MRIGSRHHRTYPSHTNTSFFTFPTHIPVRQKKNRPHKMPSPARSDSSIIDLDTACAWIFVLLHQRHPSPAIHKRVQSQRTAGTTKSTVTFATSRITVLPPVTAAPNINSRRGWPRCITQVPQLLAGPPRHPFCSSDDGTGSGKPASGMAAPAAAAVRAEQ